MQAEYLTLPDLDLGNRPIVLSLWLVKAGTHVAEGEPLVEVMSDGVTVDLPSPADGVLIEKLAADSDVLVAGQRLAVISSL
jgi:pyruvate/2-oxoglutarate dehydrogenase complex dihydrolipoamide acyltransferase (E2) component